MQILTQTFELLVQNPCMPRIDVFDRLGVELGDSNKVVLVLHRGHRIAKSYGQRNRQAGVTQEQSTLFGSTFWAAFMVQLIGHFGHLSIF